jgi:hypothetical protein
VRILREPDRKGLAGFYVALTIGIMILSPHAQASVAPTGSNFDHIVIIAMENQYYSSVLGNGVTGSSSAPFLASMLPLSSTVPNYHSYADTGGVKDGCSAACYTMFTSGDKYGVSDGVGRGSVTATNIFDRLSAAGLTWKAYCENGCPRGADHDPALQYSSTYQSPNTITTSTDFTSATNNPVLSDMSSASPSNYVWMTPTDSHNMHDVSISTGDAYLKQLLVGSGASCTLANPCTGSLFSTNLFTNPAFKPMLYIWWDEFDPSPNIEYGRLVKNAFVTPATDNYNEYASLHTIESNWAIQPLTTKDTNAPIMSDIFGSSTPGALSTSFSYSPSTPQPNQTVTFTASATGGAPPYSYGWSFGDGSSDLGASATHTYSRAGHYAVTVTVTDANSATSSVAKQVTVSVSSSSPSTLTFLYIGLIAGGAISVIAFLAKYYSRNRKLAAILKNARQARPRSRS